MTESFDIVSYAITVCPALGILAWVVVHFKGESKDLKDSHAKEIERKDARIETLTEQLVDVSRDQIKVNSEIRNILEVMKNK